MQIKKIFLASSAELKADRDQFEIAVYRKNKDWVKKGIFLELVIWEDFLDALSQTRLQDEYNKQIRLCDIFVMLFWTKVGKYTEEEFETAVGQFKATRKPFIFTYFKDVPATRTEPSLDAFKKKLDALGHFPPRYANIDALTGHFNQQLDKLVANGFIEFTWGKDDLVASSGDSYHATLKGPGAIAQGAGARAVGAGGVMIGGNNSGSINTGTQTNIDTGGGTYVGGNVTAGGDFVGRDKLTHGIASGDLTAVFAPLMAAIAQHPQPATQAAAAEQVKELKAEVAKGKQADDSKIGKIVDGLVAKVPGAVSAVVSMFATPVLGGIVGPVTQYVLDKLNGD
jgi:hypothetical protein